jgi:hypothetical protein
MTKEQLELENKILRNALVEVVRELECFHSTECQVSIGKETVCNCWLGRARKALEAVVDHPKCPQNPTRCRNCGHGSEDHNAIIRDEFGKPTYLCVRMDCGCQCYHPETELKDIQ